MKTRDIYVLASEKWPFGIEKDGDNVLFFPTLDEAMKYKDEYYLTGLSIYAIKMELCE